MMLRIRAVAHGMVLSLVVFAPPAGTLCGSELPQVRFDIPQRFTAREVLSDDPLAGRLIEVTVPISVRVVAGDIHRVKEVSIEIDAGGTGLLVHDFSPQTTLGTDLAGNIRVSTTKEAGQKFNASLGGQSPIPLGEVIAQVAPSISASKTRREVEVKTTTRLPPKKPTAVSGTLGGGRGVFFQLRPSSQTTLEGQHLLSVVFRAPDDWLASDLAVRCAALGERRVLWFDQPKIWGNARAKTRVALPATAPAPHSVAKQPVGEWVARP